MFNKLIRIYHRRACVYNNNNEEWAIPRGQLMKTNFPVFQAISLYSLQPNPSPHFPGAVALLCSLLFLPIVNRWGSPGFESTEQHSQSFILGRVGWLDQTHGSVVDRKSYAGNASARKFHHCRYETLAMQYQSNCGVIPSVLETLGINRAFVSLSCVNDMEMEMCVWKFPKTSLSWSNPVLWVTC